MFPHERKTNGNMKSMYHVPDVIRDSFPHMRNKSDECLLDCSVYFLQQRLHLLDKYSYCTDNKIQIIQVTLTKTMHNTNYIL